MKVCQLCAVDFTLKHFLLPLVDGMQSRGWEVVSVCSEGPAIAAMRAAGYRIDTVEIARSMNPVLATRSLLQLIRLFRCHRFDVLHVHTPVAALIGRIAARIAGIPLVVYTAHGFYFHEDMPRFKRSLFVALERLGGRFTDLLFSQSAEDARDAVSEGILSASRVFTIGNGVDPARFDPARIGDGKASRQALGIPEDAFVIGCIGRQVREKGIGDFLRAAQSISAQRPNIWFLLIGERLATDHSSSVEPEIAVAREVLGPRLVTPGQRTDIPECIAAMNVFCLPSWREGMPRTVIEAMMMAKPVLATDIRGSREEVLPEVTGLLVPAKSPWLLAEAMLKFADNPTWAQKLGVSGRARALEIYDEGKIVQLQLQCIEQEAHVRGLH